MAAGETHTRRTCTSPPPTPTPAPCAVSDVACGHSHTVALTPDGRLFAWGRGDSGELGLRNLSDRAAPAPVPRPDGHAWTHVGAGSYYTVALAEPLPSGQDSLQLPRPSAAATLAALRERTWRSVVAAGVSDEASVRAGGCRGELFI